MNRFSKTSAAAVALAIAVASNAALAEEKVLNIYNWFDYTGETTIADFEKETGIKVNYDTFDSLEILETKLLSGKSGYDVVVPSSNIIPRLIQAGIFQKVDRAKLGSYGNLDKQLLGRLEASDPGNSYSVPYTWGTTGIGYNVKMVENRLKNAPTDSWDLIFKPENLAKFADCGVAVIDSPAEIVGAALQYLGKDPNSEKKGDLKAAEKLLKGIRPHIKHFNTGQIINDLASGEICVAVGYSGDISLAFVRAEEIGSNVKLAYSIPKEGAQVFFDLLAVPVDAPHPENAYKFIEFMLQPKVIAGVTNTVFYANANAKAEEFIDKMILTDPGVYPPEAIRDKLFSLGVRSAKYSRLLTRAWTRIRTGK